MFTHHPNPHVCVCTRDPLCGAGRSPLGGEEAVELGAGGVVGVAAQREDVGEHVVALTAGPVLTHQLGRQKVIDWLFS